MKTNRTACILSIGLACLLAAPGRGLAADSAPSRRPNILVFLADDMGFADCGVQGCKDIPTPNIDTLAKSGARFTNGYTSGCVCSPTRAGLVSGRYQQRFGFDANAEGKAAAGDKAPRALDIQQVTFAQRMKALGYATGLIGKWHIGAGEGYRPTERGFDEFYGFFPYGIAALGPNGEPVPIYRGLDTVEIPENLSPNHHSQVGRPGEVKSLDGPGTGSKNLSPNRQGQSGRPGKTELPKGSGTGSKNHMESFCSEALAFIDRHQKEPFFLYLPFSAVHGPYVGPEPWLSQFDALVPANRRKYAADVAQMDDIIGRVMNRLRQCGLEEHTLVFFLSDNGGPGGAASNRPLRGTKWTLWEGGIHVPFVVQWKGRIPAGQVLEQPVIQVDICATAIAAAGGQIDPQWKLDGANLLPLLEGKTAAPPHAALFWRFGVQYAVRQGDWKLVKTHVNDPPRLFNLAHDLGETTDLAAKEPAKVQQLQALWDAWNADNEPPRWIDLRWNGDGPKPKKKPASKKPTKS